MVGVLIEAGATAPTEGVRHPLSLAAGEGHAATLRALLDSGGWRDGDLQDAVHDAALQGKDRVLRMLFETGRVEADSEAVFNACRAGRLICLKFLLGRRVSVKAADAKGRQPLHIVATAGYDKLIRALLQAGCEVDTRDARGRTPLMLAAAEHGWQRIQRNEHRERKRDLADPDSGVRAISGTQAEAPHARRTIQVLLEAGADPTLTDDEGHTALDLARAAPGETEDWLVRRLTAAGSPPPDELPDRVMTAVRHRDPDVLRALFDAGADPNFTTPRGDTPLTSAGRRGDVTTLAALLAGGADPNRPGRNESPLMAAAVGRNVDAVRALLDAGADPNAPEPHGGALTPLRLAKGFGYRDLVDLLVARGARLPPPEHDRIEPGVHDWDDWELVVVKAAPAAIAAVLDPGGDATDPDPLGKTKTFSGSPTLVLAQPAGLAWTNLLRVAPPRWSEDRFPKRLAAHLAEALSTEAIFAASGDGGTFWRHFGPDGEPHHEDRGGDLFEAEEAAGSARRRKTEIPDWARWCLAAAEAAGGGLPHASERLEALARAEGFALAWAGFGAAPGADFDVEFPDHAPEALVSVVLVADVEF